ncbi:polysaccharide deacetylase [Clostridium estertheticum]|uniref:polysaccharide deacetylase family protein n=1 Tax=Clostridium estertheticum TaxID=238834 RepID=UPI001CF51C62|nr:polysaccharide deacetylase family protein [Clostridium estertheticum]MCB2307451.1 polysaccharide deacetylase [Clostridium estertheticum]MCB2345708.1 polysaccharide deacetylase [Clostridium estertheticum]MCB2350940.1 polysaccharide deacetylase [Clostridium estertheticum]WAG44078.1 polysaccharide deacetylase [Clostridium estertheticum]
MKRKSLTMFTIFLFLVCFLGSQTAMAYSTLSKNDEKVIYLTFDDGPSVMTDKVLDILKTNGVNATFFLIGNQIKGYEDMVKRIYTQGNSIGLHTYTHTYNKIYSSRKGFISEMLKSQDEINSIIGVKPTIIRFPSGSSKHLTKGFLEELHGYNFKVYDWNAVMSDGVNCNTPPDKLYREATKTTVREHPIMLLMHCDYMHKNTCKALPRVIKFYKDHGYEFKIINDKTPEVYFPIKNNK